MHNQSLRIFLYSISFQELSYQQNNASHLNCCLVIISPNNVKQNLSFKSLPYVELSMGLNTSPVCLQTILPAHFTPRFFLALDGKFKCLNWILIYFVPHLTFGTAFGRQIFGRDRKLKIRFQASAKTTFRHLVFLNMRHVPRRVRIASPTTSFHWLFCEWTIWGSAHDQHASSTD